MTINSIDPRALALETFIHVEKNKIKLNEAENYFLNKYKHMQKEQRAFYSRLVAGVFEQRILLDYIINIYSNVPVNKIRPVIKNILRLAVYQIREMNSVPKSAAVNEAVKLTREKGFGNLKGYVNAVLRNILSHPEKFSLPDRSDILSYISVKYSMPEFIAKQWITQYGADVTERMCSFFLKNAKTSIRIRGGAEEIGKCVLSLKNDDVNVEKAPYLENAYYISNYDRIASLSAFKNGMFVVQNVSSMLAVEACGITPGDKILDVCAAPGAKTILAADKTGEEGMVIARDISAKKLHLINENAARCGLNNIHTEVFDAVKFDESLKESFDIVLVDAPCSGYGVIGRKPDIKYNASGDKQNALARIQKDILKTSSRYVRPGGRLVYSTCTISRGENQDNANIFTKEEGFKPYDLKRFLPETIDGAERGYIQLLPGINDCDGFFIAGFEKQ